MTGAERQHEGNTCIDMAWTPLPQPSSKQSQHYRYVPYHELETTFFPSSRRLAEDTLCWVLKSKGRVKKKNKVVNALAKSKPENDKTFQEGTEHENGSEDHDYEEKEEPTNSSTRTELFLRARVVSDNEDEESNSTRRILVRYPKGSTYRVKRCNLIPVLEAGVIRDGIVLAIPETTVYRRAAVVHTCVGECFLEIGCDYGLTVDRVRRALTEVGDVPRTDSRDNATLARQDDNGDKCYCLGIDKSQESIDIAVERYPDTCFSLEDALTKEGSEKLRLLCQEKLVAGYPSVVAVDINGNRDLPAVLECLENLMLLPDNINWHLPRLIIVKSRLLYAQVCNRIKTGLQC